MGEIAANPGGESGSKITKKKAAEPEGAAALVSS
jgi:hypothetical protein